MASLAGIEIGGTKLQLVLGDHSGNIQKRRKFQVKSGDGADGIRRQIEHNLTELIQGHDLDAVGVGFGGPVDWRTGTTMLSHQVSGWSNFDLRSWLHSLSRTPVFIDNDANVAALGEAVRGAGVGADPVFYVTLGSGVGGGLVINHHIYHGAIPGEAEIGHVRLDRNGTILESRCSGWAVDARLRELKTRVPSGIFARINGNKVGGEAKYLSQAIDQGDSAAARVLDLCAEDLAFGLSHAVHLFHPKIIVLGGGLSGVGERLRSAVHQALRPFLMNAFLPGPTIALAALGEDAVPAGALELAKASLSELP